MTSVKNVMNPPRARPRASRLQEFLHVYTKDLTADDLQRLFTRDTRDAYRFFTRGLDPESLKGLPWRFSVTIAPGAKARFGTKLAPFTAETGGK